MKTALAALHLRLGLYGYLAWAVALVLYASAIIWVYPAVSEVEGLGDYLEAMPEQFRQLAGISDLAQALDEQGFYTFEGFLSSEYMSFFPVLLGIYAVMSGAGIIAKDAETGPLDLILSQPVRRHGLLLTRAAMQACVFAALTLVSLVSLSIGAALLDEPVSYVNLALAHGVAFGLVISLFSFAVLWSALFLRASRAAAVAGLVAVFMYVLNVLAPSLGWPGWLENISPFAYYESLSLLSGGDVGLAPIFVYATITALSLGLAAVVFERRDIVT